MYGIPKYSESDEPAKTKPRVFTTQDLRKDNPFELNKEKNKVKVEEDVEVKELESQRSNLQDIISTYPLGSAGTAAIVDDPDDEYSPSSLGKIENTYFENAYTQFENIYLVWKYLPT